MGAAFASIPNLIVNAVDSHETGEATGVNTIIRNIGSAIGAQVAGVIIASHVIATGVEDSGFTLAFLLSAVGALVAAASVLLIPGRVREPVASAA
jgi:predicted MFS family arabinose efflux permease